MKHRQRGKALIFNNENFAKMTDRTGTQIDEERLKTILKKRGFEVVVHQNFKAGQIRDALGEGKRQIRGFMLILASPNHQ